MIKNTQIILSCIVLILVAVYGVMIYNQLTERPFTPSDMTHPGMMIAFIAANTFNIARLVSKTKSSAIYYACILSATLTLGYATAFTLMEHSASIGKTITTVVMALVWVFLLIDTLRLHSHQPTEKWS